MYDDFLEDLKENGYNITFNFRKDIAINNEDIIRHIRQILELQFRMRIDMCTFNKNQNTLSIDCFASPNISCLSIIEQLFRALKTKFYDGVVKIVISKKSDEVEKFSYLRLLYR